MEEFQINFFYENIDFELSNSEQINIWLHKIAKNYHFRIQELTYIFCDDEYLHKINVEYLKHDTYTDIITFDNSEEMQKIEGDIFISIERVKENANLFKVKFEQELWRVIAHGFLHLLGFGDKTEDEQKLMRIKENEAINLLIQNN